MLEHPKIFECFSDCFLFFWWTLGLSGILGFRQIIVFAYLIYWNSRGNSLTVQ